MFFNQNRQQSRQMFFDSWKKHRAGEPLEPLEKQIVSVIDEHPEYHALLHDPADVADRDFGTDGGEENPFMHMGMHLALREQVGTDRPAGIKAVTRALLLKYQDGHHVEHLMMEKLGLMLWNAQVANTLPDEQAYLESLKTI